MLTTEQLTYAKDKGKWCLYVIVAYNQTSGERPLCFIPTREIQAVERVDDETFGMKFVCLFIMHWRLVFWYFYV